MDKKLGLIGCGNMGLSMVGGIVSSGLITSDNIMVADKYQPSLERAKETYGVKATTENTELSEYADIIILALKPDLYPIVIDEIKDCVKEDAIIVTIAAGKDLASTEEAFGKDVKVVRVMPNTPAMVGEGMAALSPNKHMTKEETAEIVQIFESFGEAEIVPESLMDVVTGVSGSGPAYVFMFIEAMADGGVVKGMPRNQAYKFAAQTVLGAAKMVMETGKHPGELKDMVSSPGGTTIAAVAKLEEQGLRNAVIEGVKACTEKSIEMSK